MRIKFVEIQNFRKLRSCRIEFAEKTTVFVGANNSGKTSAMNALIMFLSEDSRFNTTDLTLSNWNEINKIGESWVKNDLEKSHSDLSMLPWQRYLCSIDVWIEAANNEIHYVNHIIPTLDWNGGLLGIRLRFEPKDVEDLYKDYLSSFKSAKKTIETSNRAGKNTDLKLWPRTMRDFLDKRLNTYFTVRAYILDPKNRNDPKDGIAQPQELSDDNLPLEGDPFKGMIEIDKIVAQRGFSDPSDSQSQQARRKLSVQLRTYYAKHIESAELADPSDIDALEAIEKAQLSFDEKLKDGFRAPLSELESLGYPSFTDPKITISSQIQPMDGLNHESAVQFEVISSEKDGEKISLRLPEKYNGLGYQNLISMVFDLMSFRDEWMQVGKVAKKVADKKDGFIPPLHFVLVEEPEAHLHAQVQQIFIRKAYAVLRKHDNLGDKKHFTTQLVVSTHSSHIAHEIEFASLRYFRRNPAQKSDEVPTATVVNLSEVFGTGKKTDKFAARYLKTTHCDLFFADAAILIEGAAERMLVPHFIRHHFEKLNGSYISLLEIGGSHAHRLRPLIEHLGLITLIITDLDSKDSKVAVRPIRGKGYISGNSTLRKWVPARKIVDELLDATFSDKIQGFVRVVYPCPVKIEFDGNKEEALPYTFEDALAFDNLELFKGLNRRGLIKTFGKAIKDKRNAESLGLALFNALKNGDKAEFALELLYLKEPEELKVPTYINEGLSWLQEQLEKKQKDVLLPITAVQGVQDDGK